VAVDEGADSMLRRVPWGVDLAVAAGFEVTTPATGEASLLLDSRLVPLPSGTLMGIPTDLAAVRPVVGEVTDRGTLDVHDDVSVGALVEAQLGRAVVDRLVDPLLGGVYAGRADALSVRMTLPQLWPHLTGTTSLVAAAREARGTPTPGPVFAGVPGGLGNLPPALAKHLDVRLGVTVRGLERTPTGWRLLTGSAASPAYVEADAVVLAVPAAPAARLLAGHAEVPPLEYASVGIITLVLDGPTPGRGSGYLVPAVEGRVTKAVTFTSRKWDRPGPAVVRVSVGRAGEVADLQRDDEDLVAAVLSELAEVVGPLPPLLGTRVTRWGGGLPQYAPGHVDRVASLRAALPPGIAVAGAAYDGVGVPAVARSGQDAARALTMDPWPSPLHPRKS
jgi:oxygen-dependent protoporphyrinogen oxidase